MQKTPDEIKKGLECCKPKWMGNHWKTCDTECPYVLETDSCRSVLNDDALALIQRLEAAQTQWISVKERLPERGFKVLTVNGHGYIRIFALWKRTEREWCWINDAGHFNHCNDITHWMQLPEPPEVKL